LLASHVVGVQTADDQANFLGCVEQWLEAEVDRSSGVVEHRGGRTTVGVYPVGIETPRALLNALPGAAGCRAAVLREHGLPSSARIAVGVDRLDYSKGLIEKFLAVERLLESRPALQGQFVLLQVAEPSRQCLDAYREIRDEVLATSRRINTRFGGDGYQPIVLIDRHQDAREVYTLYRAADVCIVSSLADGMNLVAKEFAAAREDERGVLVLSIKAGAAKQLRSALLVDPRDVEGMAGSLNQALEMSPAEQMIRMRVMRATVAGFGHHWWTEQLMNAAAATRVPPVALQNAAVSAIASRARSAGR
jgi:trehalose 6-phosphate synthase